MTRREELLLDLDHWNRHHRAMSDAAHDARIEKLAVEDLLKEEQKAEIKTLRAAAPAGPP